MNKFVHYGFVLFFIASICAGGLSIINAKTSPIIIKRAIEMEREARSIVVAEADEFRVEESKEIEGYNFIPAYKGGEKIAYVVAIKGSGYGGDISMMLGVSLDGKVEGLNIISAQETPGLGDKIFDKGWQNMWKGRSSKYQFEKGTDAFAGATVSPMAVHNAIKETLTLFEEKVMN